MPSESPGLRPLSIIERWFTTAYGSVPSGFVMFALRALFLWLSGPDVGAWQFVRYTFGFSASLGIHVDVVDTLFVPNVLGSGMYAVFYFSFGRSLGHMAINAHVVDARTGRRMRTWQKAIRSVLQIANGYLGFFRILDIISTLTVIIDREQRRSVYDLAARTVVVIGEPAEDEPESARQQSRMAAWFGQLTRKEQAG